MTWDGITKHGYYLCLGRRAFILPSTDEPGRTTVTVDFTLAGQIHPGDPESPARPCGEEYGSFSFTTAPPLTNPEAHRVAELLGCPGAEAVVELAGPGAPGSCREQVRLADVAFLLERQRVYYRDTRVHVWEWSLPDPEDVYALNAFKAHVEPVLKRFLAERINKYGEEGAKQRADRIRRKNAVPLPPLPPSALQRALPPATRGWVAR